MKRHTIPIQNLYYLLCYAWDKLEAKGEVSLAAEPGQQLIDLLGSVFLQGCGRLIKRGLMQDYVEDVAVAKGIKGRLEVAPSVRKGLFLRGQAQCRYDELSHDILPNQVVGHILHQLSRSSFLLPHLAKQAKRYLHHFPPLQPITLLPHHFRSLRRLSLKAPYPLLLNICELLDKNLLPTEKEGIYRFIDFWQDEAQMAVLFEGFVRNFYKYEAPAFRVGREHILWHLLPLQEEAKALLPRMETDVSLVATDFKLIIDTKYYVEALATNRFGGKKFRPPHLYQLFAYIKNVEHKDMLGPNCQGMLLYPTAGPTTSYDYQMEGHLMRVVALSLSQEWHGIHRDLLGLLEG